VTIACDVSDEYANWLDYTHAPMRLLKSTRQRDARSFDTTDGLVEGAARLLLDVSAGALSSECAGCSVRRFPSRWPRSWHTNVLVVIVLICKLRFHPFMFFVEVKLLTALLLALAILILELRR